MSLINFSFVLWVVIILLLNCLFVSYFITFPYFLKTMHSWLNCSVFSWGSLPVTTQDLTGLKIESSVGEGTRGAEFSQKCRTIAWSLHTILVPSPLPYLVSYLTNLTISKDKGFSSHKCFWCMSCKWTLLGSSGFPFPNEDSLISKLVSKHWM